MSVELLLLDGSRRAVAELPLLSFDGSVQLNGPGQATIDVALGNETGVDALLLPWRATVVLVVDGVPAWGGVVVKRKTKMASPVMTLECREWSYWLEKVWSAENFGWEPDVDVDGGTAIYRRIVSAVTQPSVAAAVRPPLLSGPWSGVSGVMVDVDFPEQWEESSPQSYADELKHVVDLGTDWWMPWRYSQGVFSLGLVTKAYNPGAAPSAHVDLSTVDDAEIIVDGENLANDVKVVASDQIESIKRAADAGGYPPAMLVKSYEHLGELAATDAEVQAKADAYATALLSQLSLPVTTLDQVRLQGLHAADLLGQMVEFSLPGGEDFRYPEGFSFAARTESVEWNIDPKSERTTLRVASTLDSLPNAPSGGATGVPRSPTVLPKGSLPEFLAELLRRVGSLEARR